MILTREMIFKAQTERGAWNSFQLELIGVSWPPKSGWIERSIGKEISAADFEKFCALGRITKTQRRELRRKRAKSK